jgi:hypothetical protein
MNRCFVIQPFSDPYDKRYRDVFCPAITAAGLEPYRVDGDLAADYLIEDIQRGIADSAMCFAEISTDNPNVWYELGFAHACKKSVVMVCHTGERKGKFPFDIQNRLVLGYTGDSTSDFERLKESITGRFKALGEKEGELGQMRLQPITQDMNGLQPHELATLYVLLVNSSPGIAYMGIIETDMEKAGFTQGAARLGLNVLAKMGLAELQRGTDMNSEEWHGYSITKAGIDWMQANQDKVQLRKLPRASRRQSDDEPPF